MQFKHTYKQKEFYVRDFYISMFEKTYYVQESI